MTRILVADDDPDIRSAVLSLLDAEGYITASAPNGVAALRIMTQGDIDLVILDIFMPEKDGIDVLKERQDLKLAAVPPVIAISGGGNGGTANFGLTAARALGVAAVLYKPFSSEELIQAIQKTLS